MYIYIYCIWFEMYIRYMYIYIVPMCVHCVTRCCTALHHALTFHCLTSPYHTWPCHTLHTIPSVIHCITLHYTSLHRTTWHDFALHCITWYRITLLYIAIHCNALPCITLHYIPVHYNVLPLPLSVPLASTEVIVRIWILNNLTYSNDIKIV